uniref:Uncharacterized protein n=1 Tax=Rhinolophus ferrumequinum TaxID=59479 RepID=A0A671DL80_RHIFE
FLWKLEPKVITLIILVPAYSKFISLLSHLNEGVNTTVENVFPHLSVFRTTSITTKLKNNHH